MQIQTQVDGKTTNIIQTQAHVALKYKYNHKHKCSWYLSPNEESCILKSKVWADPLCKILLETAQMLSHFKIQKSNYG